MRIKSRFIGTRSDKFEISKRFPTKQGNEGLLCWLANAIGFPWENEFWLWNYSRCGKSIWVKQTTCFHNFPEYESTNFFYQILCNICIDFLTCSKLWKNVFFFYFTNKEFVFFFKWEILMKKLVDSYSENSWKHVVSSIIDSKCQMDHGQDLLETWYLEKLIFL